MSDEQFQNMWLQRLYEILSWLNEKYAVVYDYSFVGEKEPI